MSTNNKVFQVLVTKGNAAIASVGDAIEDLAVGQIGIFDAETNLAIDGSVPVKDFYLAVGVNNNGGNTVEKVLFSAGQNIQKDYVRNVNLQPYVAPVDFVFDLANFTKALNDVEYGVKMEFRNMQIYMRQGTNQFTKTFTVTTSANEDVDPIIDLAKKLIAEFNLDESEMFTASAVTALGVAIPDLDAWGVANPGAAPHIRITANEVAIYKYLGINPRYYYPRQTVIIPSLVTGFTSEATLTTVTEGVAEQGNSYDIKQKEYKAGGFNGQPGPYRTSSTLGFPYQGIEYNAVDGKTYLQINLVYDFFSTAGWGEYLNNLQTIIAVPMTDKVTSASLVSALNDLLNTTLVDPLAN